MIIGSVGAFSFLPWNNGATILDFNVGVFLLTAISSIGVVGIFLAGWGSNNKYSVVSAMRGAVQMISYEMSLCLCLITAVILTGTMQMQALGNGSSSRDTFLPSSPSSYSSLPVTLRLTVARSIWLRLRVS